jgi:hypothetical protein
MSCMSQKFGCGIARSTVCDFVPDLNHNKNSQRQSGDMSVLIHHLKHLEFDFEFLARRSRFSLFVRFQGDSNGSRFMSSHSQTNTSCESIRSASRMEERKQEIERNESEIQLPARKLLRASQPVHFHSCRELVLNADR